VVDGVELTSNQFDYPSNYVQSIWDTAIWWFTSRWMILFLVIRSRRLTTWWKRLKYFRSNRVILGLKLPCFFYYEWCLNPRDCGFGVDGMCFDSTLNVLTLLFFPWCFSFRFSIFHYIVSVVLCTQESWLCFAAYSWCYVISCFRSGMSCATTTPF